MAVIPQKQLFQWEEIENLGDLERLRLVLESLPDEPLMRHLERDRAKGRNDYPIRATWNSVIGGIVFQHKGIEHLRRELLRNAQLRQVCGFGLGRAGDVVPTSWAYTRFLKLLLDHRELIDAMFDELVDELRELLPDFGETLALDGKAIETHANPRREDAATSLDGRRDLDANWGKKTVKGTRKDGSAWEQVKAWFGYKLHLMVDTTHELPIAFSVTPASHGEQPQGRKLLAQAAHRHPKLIERSEYLYADKGYDDGTLISQAWDDHGIKPIIPIRDLWKDGEETKRVDGTRNIVYDAVGTVSCVCMKTGQLHRMVPAGFEADRNALKYRCPAIYHGIDCAGKARCPAASCVRIPLQQDRRIFTPIARNTPKWDRLYADRTAVERVNSRLDVSFGFEEHFIRGLAKMQLRCGLALIVMLAMAVGRIKHNQQEHMRSLVRAA